MLRSKSAHPFKLTSSPEFQRCQEAGKKQVFKSLIVWALPNHSDDTSRLGMIISRRVGKAIVRNRLKRIVREIFKRMQKTIEAHDIVILVRPLQGLKLKAIEQFVRADMNHCAHRYKRS